MTDLEKKVIKGLECCKWSRQNVKPEKNKCDECPYKDQGIMNAFTVWRSCTNVLAKDTLAMLREQDAVEPREQEETHTWTVCGNCSQHLISKWLWCPYCGRKIKWNNKENEDGF